MSRLTWRRLLSGVVLLGSAGIVWSGAAVARWEHPGPSLAARVQGGRFLEPGDGVRQRERNDCGPAALAHCLRRLGVPAPYPDPETTVQLTRRGCGFDQLVREAERWGMRAEHRRMDPRCADSVAPPAVLYLRRGHFVVLEGTDELGNWIVHDPALGRVSFSPNVLTRLWSGDVLEFYKEEER